MGNSRKDIQAAAAERFAADVAQHQMSVQLDQGFYRHLRCSAPHTGMGWFEIVTWPGSLAVRGDMDAGYVFHRIDDMFAFFRGNGNERGINPSYWAEKLDHGPRSATKRYSEDLFRQQLDEELAEYAKAYDDLARSNDEVRDLYEAADYTERWPFNRQGPRPPLELKTPDEVRELLTDYDDDGAFAFEDGARQVLSQLETHGVLSDTSEWRLTDWDYHFLWTCHSIVWAIRQYDAVKAASPAEEG